MKFEDLGFGSVVIDGKRYDKDIVIDKGKIAKRDKKASKPKAAKYGHTPLTARENIPWDCKVLVIGTGHSQALPVTGKVTKLAREKRVELKLMPTPKALEFLSNADLATTNAVLHLTC